MALRWCLAELLLAEYGKESQLVMRNAAQAKGMIKRNNMNPQSPSRLDSILTSRKGQDASFVLHGNFV